MSFTLGDVAEALWPGERALTLIYHGDKGDQPAAVVDLRCITDWAQLGPYWTLSVPAWVADAVHGGSLDLTNPYYLPVIDKSGTAYWRKLRHHPEGVPGQEHPQFDYYTNRFLCVEIDYLLVDPKDSPSDEMKRFQAMVVHEALKQSEFPFNVLVDSGSKSIHAYIRLSDDPQTIASLRKDLMPHLCEVLSMALGNFDEGVFKQAGRVRLLRTPGATRDNGVRQEILAVNPDAVTCEDLLTWCYTQLMPEVVAELKTRAPAKKEIDRPYQLKYGGSVFRKELIQVHPPGGRGTSVYRLAMELGRTGSRQPRMITRPSPQQETGVFDAPFLWWVMAITFNAYSSGWFFSQDYSDWKDEAERVRWPTFHEVKDRLKDDQDYIAKQQALVAEQSAAGPQLNSAAIQMVAGGGNKKEFPPSDYAAQFLGLFPVKPIRLSKRYGDHWYVFDRVWSPVDDDVLQSMMLKTVGYNFMPAQVSGVMHHVKSSCLLTGPFQEPTNCIVFRNGTLYYDNEDDGGVAFDWLPDHFDPTDHCTKMIPHDYVPGSQCPRFMEWLVQMQPEETNRFILQEWAGYIFWPGNSLQKWMMTYGEGNNGKGTFLRILTAMVGRDNAKSLTMADLATDRFALGGKTEALLCHEGDIPATVGKFNYDPGKVASKVKEWVGGDDMDVQDKNIKSWTTSMRAKLMCSGNEFPGWMSDGTKGFWRRVLPVPFSVELNEADVIHDLEQSLIKNEMPGIISWAVEGLRRLRSPSDRGEGIYRGFTFSPEVERLKEKFQEEVDSVYAFVKDYIEPIDGEATMWYDAKPVMEAYREFCQQEALYCYDKMPRFVTKFNRALKDLGVTQMYEIKRPPCTVTPRPRHGYQGLRCTYESFQAPTLNHNALASGNTIPFRPPTPPAPLEEQE